MRWLWLVLFLVHFAGARAEESLPAKPSRYVSDRAFILDQAAADALNTRLADYERETSNQVVVALFSNLPPGAELAQYSTQVFRFWKVGQADKDNGVVLFVYKNDRKLFIATGRGLEGALPDVLCKQIIENEIVPRFRAGDFAGGIQAGTDAILAATKGEYKGTGKTVQDGERSGGKAGKGGDFVPILFLIVFLFIVIQNVRKSARDRVLNSRGLFNYGGANVFGQGDSWGGGSSSGGSSWGGGGGGDGGGFSSGGGDSGGGGAGGSW